MRGVAQRTVPGAVDGIVAKGSAGAPRSSPGAAERFAEGKGLDGGDPGRCKIDHAVDRQTESTERGSSIAASATPRIYTSLTDATRVTASQIASASAASFLPRLT